MTDNEIIKALECCSTVGVSCEACPAYIDAEHSKCRQALKGALDLINRQKAEIERLENSLAISKKETKRILVTKGGRGYGKTRAEAVKEFAERLKGKAFCFYDGGFAYQMRETDIDNLVKEMVGEGE